VKKTTGGTPGAWCSSLPATASSVASGCRAQGAERTQRRVGEAVGCRRPSLRAFVEDKDEAAVRVDSENRRCMVTTESP
jgi:hypothetical protein